MFAYYSGEIQLYDERHPMVRNVSDYAASLLVAVASLATTLLGNAQPNESCAERKPGISLTAAGEIKVADLLLHAASVIDESTVALVGGHGPEDALPDKLDPSGAIVDLATKAVRSFT